MSIIQTTNIYLESTANNRIQYTGSNTVQVVSGGSVAFISNASLTSFSKPIIVGSDSLTSNTAWDGSTKQSWSATVNGGSFTIANPSVLISNAYYAIYVSYTTSHSISWGANFKGVSNITPTATTGARDHFVFRASNTTYLECVGYALDIGA